MYRQVIHVIYLLLGIVISDVEMKKVRAKSVLRARQGVQQLQQVHQYSQPVIGTY